MIQLMLQVINCPSAFGVNINILTYYDQTDTLSLDSFCGAVIDAGGPGWKIPSIFLNGGVLFKT
jgi:hypothetical protein